MSVPRPHPAPGVGEPGPSGDPGGNSAPRRPGLTRRGWWLAAEYALIFFVVVGVYAVVDPPVSPIVPLVVLTPLALLYLRRVGVGRRLLIGADRLRASMPSILRVWAAAAVLAVVAILVIDPGRLFFLPRHEPLLWAVIVVAYPLLSVYPQELLFRGFLMHRYAPVFGTGAGVAAASAVAFGFAHILFGSLWSVLLTVVGGWLFARRYQRTGSLLVASVEHALYGILAFTVGWGDLFYAGAR